MDKAPVPKTTKVENEKLVAILSYFLIGIIWYFVDDKMKKSELVKFHVKQSLNLALFSIVLSIALSIVSPILVFIPIVGWLALLVLGFGTPIFTFVLFIMGVINAANEKKKEVPLIGQFAKKYLTF